MDVIGYFLGHRILSPSAYAMYTCAYADYTLLLLYIDGIAYYLLPVARD